MTMTKQPGTRKARAGGMVFRLRGTGPGKIGEPYDVRPHLGDQLLQKYRDRISSGWEDLEKFELIDRLQKPVLWFHLYGHKKMLLELFHLLDATPYAFWIRPDKADHIWKLPDDMRRRGAGVYISRFPKLIRFIEKSKGVLSDDLWGLLHGYPVHEVHQFAYDHDAFRAKQGLDSDKMTEPPEKSREVDAAELSRMRGITEWISVFQWEEYGERGADSRQGRAMEHFNVFLARHGGLLSKVSKHSHMVNAPISELNADHFRDFLAWIPTQTFHEDVGKEWYAPTLAKFIQWLKDNKAITDGKRRELCAAWKTTSAMS